MKQNKKAKICFVIYIAGFFFKKKFCYEVIVKQKKTERFRLYYSSACRVCHVSTRTGPRDMVLARQGV